MNGKLTSNQAYNLLKCADPERAGSLGATLTRAEFTSLKKKGLVESVSTRKGMVASFLTRSGKETAGVLLVAAALIQAA